MSTVKPQNICETGERPICYDKFQQLFWLCYWEQEASNFKQPKHRGMAVTVTIPTLTTSTSSGQSWPSLLGNKDIQFFTVWRHGMTFVTILCMDIVNIRSFHISNSVSIHKMNIYWIIIYLSTSISILLSPTFYIAVVDMFFIILYNIRVRCNANYADTLI